MKDVSNSRKIKVHANSLEYKKKIKLSIGNLYMCP